MSDFIEVGSGYPKQRTVAFTCTGKLKPEEWERLQKEIRDLMKKYKLDCKQGGSGAGGSTT